MERTHWQGTLSKVQGEWDRGVLREIEDILNTAPDIDDAVEMKEDGASNQSSSVNLVVESSAEPFP
jgi:hypothetical protein